MENISPNFGIWIRKLNDERSPYIHTCVRILRSGYCVSDMLPALFHKHSPHAVSILLHPVLKQHKIFQISPPNQSPVECEGHYLAYLLFIIELI
jgi:hypothetical protein